MSRVRVGLDRFLAEPLEQWGLQGGARLGLVAHAASVDGTARDAPGLLADDPRVRLERLFGPEHGLWGHEQDMEQVGEAVDPRTGCRVFSLYGANEASLRPDPAWLEGLDAILFDLQDVGSRYYTYVYTLSFLMESAAEVGVPIVVLDRPNPIGGTLLEGPILDPAYASFVGRYPLPVRHGMTCGELARWFASTQGLDADLRIVPMQGWKREMDFRATGLPWVPPSPNMPTPRTALVYPGGCLIEGTTLSEARGTTTPFELVGAPGMDGHALAAALDRAELPGVRFRAASFRPMFQKHAMRSCGGVQVIPTDPITFRPFETYLWLLREAQALLGNDFGWRSEVYEFVGDRLAIDLLLGDRRWREALEAGEPPDAMAAGWQPALDAFRNERSSFLLYESGRA